jgi:hypothetical protein
MNSRWAVVHYCVVVVVVAFRRRWMIISSYVHVIMKCYAKYYILYSLMISQSPIGWSGVIVIGDVC